MKQSSGIAKNSLMLMAMNIAKMLFPLLTLPYLTRVLSTDCYGSVVYVKSVTTYLQLLVDFGFVLSATKSIVQAREDRARQERIMGDVLLARLWLAGAALVLLGFTSPRRMPCHNVMSHLVYAASGHDVVMTMVRGQVLYAAGKYPTIDLDSVVRELSGYVMPRIFEEARS